MIGQRELLIQVANEMPQNSTIEEIVNEVLLRISLLRGFKDFKEGKLISNEDAIKEIMSWN
jgi:hypothetical protein